MLGLLKITETPEVGLNAIKTWPRTNGDQEHNVV